jgi:hypothetical protein
MCVLRFIKIGSGGNMKRIINIQILVSMFIITLFLVTTVPIKISATNSFDKTPGQYFKYENDFFTYNATILEEKHNIFTLQETYYYPDGDICTSYITNYDRYTRKIISPNFGEYFLWIWINEDDLLKPVIQCGDKSLTLIETTSNYYIFTYSESSGSYGTLYYDKDSLMLSRADDVITTNEVEKYSSITLSDTGYEQLNSENIQNNVLNDLDDSNDGFYTLSTTTYSPPYYGSGGHKYHNSEFRCIATASWFSSIFSIHYNYGEVDSGPHIPGLFPLGRGIAQSWAWVIGPGGGMYTCSQSGTYKVEMDFTLDGASQVSIVNAGWMGSGSASGKNTLTVDIRDYDTGYLAGSKTVTLFEESAMPTMFKTWNNKHKTISLNVNFYSGHSYDFLTELYAEFRAGHVWLGAGFALTGLEAQLTEVRIIPQ